MKDRRPRLPDHVVPAVLGALACVGCTATPEPNVHLSPDVVSEPSSGEAPPSELAPGDQPGAEPMPEDPPPPEPEPRAEPTPADIDRAIREALGDDPLALVGEPGGRDAQFPLIMNERVESWISYFQNVIPERFGLYLERKARYEPMIRRKLREAGMPQDLIYLALIESGMNPYAYSRARAVGMWQFIASTGRAYDMEISFWIDERRNPEKATDAAIRYLSDLYRQFGSWYLAAAAYNGGPGRIRRGLRRVEGGSFWDLADARLLRRETRDYVPKIIAAAIIGHHPERYGFGDLQPQAPVDVEIVTVPDATSFDVLAEAAGTDQETIRELNPEYPQRVTPPGRAVSIRVPTAGAAGFETRYAAVPVDERVTWTYHVVTRGQTLGEIAGRYGVTVAGLRAANNNVNPRRLRIGQQLVIPNSARMASRSGARTSTSPPRAAPAPQTRSEVQGGPVTVVVRRGDSLWSIARRYSVSTRQIMEWNRLTSARIYPGDRLEIKR
ncbi:MAG: LysM peptidoglycan-binding domain-containing protein [Gemmatimonadetes bacterium]|nr:LysM peptidoglycan-binding domain-containing protein [Gemmatimonadota bacterium]